MSQCSAAVVLVMGEVPEVVVEGSDAPEEPEAVPDVNDVAHQNGDDG